MSLKASLITTPTTLSLTKLVSAFLAELAKLAKLVEGAGLTIANWPSTFGLRPLGDHHLSRLRPSSRLILGQFVSLLVSTRRLAQLPVRFVWFTLLGEFCQTMH